MVDYHPVAITFPVSMSEPIWEGEAGGGGYHNPVLGFSFVFAHVVLH